MIPAGRTIVMSKLALVEPLADQGHMTAQERYPLRLVISGVLTFCLTVWAIVILAVAHFA
jgi:hypothetical protein